MFMRECEEKKVIGVCMVSEGKGMKEKGWLCHHLRPFLSFF